VKGGAKALTFSPSISSEAGSQGADSMLHIGGRGKLSFCPFPFRGKVPKAGRGSFCPLLGLASVTDVKSVQLRHRRALSFLLIEKKQKIKAWN
jgi:hypothetical protein